MLQKQKNVFRSADIITNFKQHLCNLQHPAAQQRDELPSSIPTPLVIAKAEIDGLWQNQGECGPGSSMQSRSDQPCCGNTPVSLWAVPAPVSYVLVLFCLLWILPWCCLDRAPEFRLTGKEGAAMCGLEREPEGTWELSQQQNQGFLERATKKCWRVAAAHFVVDGQ